MNCPSFSFISFKKTSFIMLLLIFSAHITQCAAPKTETVTSKSVSTRLKNLHVLMAVAATSDSAVLGKAFQRSKIPLSDANSLIFKLHAMMEQLQPELEKVEAEEEALATSATPKPLQSPLASGFGTPRPATAQTAAARQSLSGSATAPRTPPASPMHAHTAQPLGNGAATAAADLKRKLETSRSTGSVNTGAGPSRAAPKAPSPSAAEKAAADTKHAAELYCALQPKIDAFIALAADKTKASALANKLSAKKTIVLMPANLFSETGDIADFIGMITAASTYNGNNLHALGAKLHAADVPLKAAAKEEYSTVENALTANRVMRASTGMKLDTLKVFHALLDNFTL